MSKTVLSFLLMDGPFEQSRTTTAFRMIDAALDKGYDVKVFTYEGGVSLAFAHQKPHANSVPGRTFDEENHPLTKDWITALFNKAKSKGCELEWVNCGLCVDERGVNDAVEGCRRGAPKDFWEWSKDANGTLVIGTR